MRQHIRGLWIYWLRPILYGIGFMAIASVVCNALGASVATALSLMDCGAAIGFEAGFVVAMMQERP